MCDHLASQMSEVTVVIKEMTNSPDLLYIFAGKHLVILVFFVSNTIKNGLIARKGGIYKKWLAAMEGRELGKGTVFVCLCCTFAIPACSLNNAEFLL